MKNTCVYLYFMQNGWKHNSQSTVAKTFNFPGKTITDASEDFHWYSKPNKSQIIRPISIKMSIRHTVREKVSFLQKLQNME